MRGRTTRMRGRGRRYRRALPRAAALAGGLGFAALAVAAAPYPKLPPRANAVWVYDQSGTGNHHVDPGRWVDALNAYNREAGTGHRISMIYSYAGDLEMYCQEAGNGAPACPDPGDLVVTYRPHGAAHRSAAAYREGIDTGGGQPVMVAPVIDGSIRGHYRGSLRGFDRLSPAQAGRFADKVARRVCADPDADGIQFDIEPFRVDHRNGQYWFYMRIARDFSGASGRFGCVDSRHPDGRFFSIFTTAHSIRPGSASARNVAAILHAHHNGYLVDALYDLGSAAPGHQTSLAAYRRQVRAEARNMHGWAARLDIPYQYAIPAAAGYHEFQTCRGPGCRLSPGGPSQLDYVRAALAAIRAQPASARFRGVALWTWERRVGRGRMHFGPSHPDRKVLGWLAGHL
ncbi:MAG TPA: hypothetical protein VFA86_03565 [Gammaproteobacteria bacterium]|nr:hypothetical protein [Gammaproteobacteria bacterium]